MRRWGPTGVFAPVEKPVVLSDEEWRDCREAFKKHMKRDAPAELRAALNDALLVYQIVDQAIGPEGGGTGRGSRHVSTPAKPKQIRRNLRETKEAALRLVNRINALDGNSRKLVDEVNEHGLKGLFDDVIRTATILAAAEARAQEYPTDRSGMIDFASRDMGYYLARAVRHFCAEKKVSATRDGLYHQMFLLLFRALGKPYENRAGAMKQALQHARERFRNGEDEPLLAWEESNEKAD